MIDRKENYIFDLGVKGLIDLLMFLYPGFSTLGEIESVLLVGPIAPATYLFTPKNILLISN